MQVTASKSDLLLGCTYPFGESAVLTPREPGEAAEYGTQLHKWLEYYLLASMGTFSPESLTWGDEVASHGERIGEFLLQWCDNNHYRVVGVERHLAAKISKTGVAKTRGCKFDAATHTYNLRAGEIGGTYDVLLEADDGTRCVLDLKSGDYGAFHKPQEMPQMLTLALATRAEYVAVLHSPRGGLPPIIYHEPVTFKRLKSHGAALYAAMQRIGDGSLRPGEWCRYCPAKENCVAFQGSNIIAASSLVRTANAGNLFKGDKNPAEMKRVFGVIKKLYDSALADARIKVEAGEVFEDSEGKVLTLVEKTVEDISKKSILEALGPEDGENAITALRALGCIKSTTRVEMHSK